MTEGKMIDADTVEFSHPVIDGFVCAVQHSVASGKPVSREPGSIGVGVVTLPTGQPRLVVQTKHSDGASLASVLNRQEATMLIECLLDGIAAATAISVAADGEPRQ